MHKCNRTQVRPATNEEAEGIETVTSLLPNLTEAVREGRTRHFADITDEGDSEDDDQKVVEGDVMDVRLCKPDSQPEPELNALANCNAMEIGVGDRRVRFRDETSESVVPLHSSEAGSSELQQVSTADASDNPTGARLYMSMTEEGPAEDYKMTMQRDKYGRWMPTKEERTMNIQKAREEKRSFDVGDRKKHGTFSIASAEASLLHREFYLSRRNADEVS